MMLKQTDMVIVSEKDSAAEKYAVENGLLFEDDSRSVGAFDVIMPRDEHGGVPVWFIASGGVVFAVLTGIFLRMATRRKRG
jgi:hypothetical protein